jgi:hypothetical protein
LKSEADRRKTFEGWSVPFMDKNSLAVAGFYYTSRGDIVRCAFCGVEVGCWQQEDWPLEDHKYFSPSCGFVKGFVFGNIPIDKPETSQEPARSKAVCGCGFKVFLSKNNPTDKPEPTRSRDVCGSFMELRPNSRPEQGKKTYLYSFLCVEL